MTPYSATGSQKICWGCGQPFVIRNGISEAIVGADNHLYCYDTGCEDEAAVRHAGKRAA